MCTNLSDVWVRMLWLNEAMESINYNQAIYQWGIMEQMSFYEKIYHTSTLSFYSPKSWMRLVMWTLIEANVAFATVCISVLDCLEPCEFLFQHFLSCETFVDFIFLSPHMTHLRRVIQSFSELFNLELALSSYAGIKIQNVSFKVSDVKSMWLNVSQ